MAIKLIAIDLDGTLLRSKWKVHPKNVAMIARVHEQKPDVKVIIATGRPLVTALPHAKTCGIDQSAAHLICYNGSNIIDITNEDKIVSLYENVIGKAEVAVILNYANINNISFWGYATDNKTVYVNKKSFCSWKSWIFEHFNKMTPIKMTTENVVSLYKILLYCSKKELNTILTDLQKKYDLEFAASLHHVIEVNPKATNKASAVQFLCEKWNIKPTEVLALGDGMNDYKLIAWAKYGIAMANSPSQLKAIAYAVTDTNKNAGVAKAIKKYVFEE